MNNNLQWGAGAIGATLGFFFGGWSVLLGILGTLVIFDYVSGLLAAAARGELKSKVGFVGIARKICIVLLVACAHFADVVLSTGDAFRDGAIFFYIVNELISVTENMGRLGVPVPPVIMSAVEVLKNLKLKGENKNG